MDNLPLVSICMPAYNSEKYIRQALESIHAQSYPNIELIIVNDGSTDRTSEIMQEYAGERVTLIHQENKGQAASCNVAFSYAKGQFIKFMDSDDLISEDFIKNQVERIEGREDAVATAAWGRFYENNVDTFKSAEEPIWKDMPPIDWIVQSLGSGANMMQCGLFLIPRSVLQRSGLWDERLTLINDFDFFIRVILSAKEMLFAEDAVLYYRSGINSLSAQTSRKAMESAFLSLNLGVTRLLQAENSERTRKAAADTLQFWKYNFYPRDIDLYRQLENSIRDLGGSSYPYHVGGWSRVVASVFGWKLTQRIKYMLSGKP